MDYIDIKNKVAKRNGFKGWNEIEDVNIKLSLVDQILDEINRFISTKESLPDNGDMVIGKDYYGAADVYKYSSIAGFCKGFKCGVNIAKWKRYE